MREISNGELATLARAGNPDAQFRSAQRLLNGLGVENPDAAIAQAKVWLEAASRQGHERAKATLAELSL